MAKKLVGTMKLQIAAGQANPSPPVGPALGQRGIGHQDAACVLLPEKSGQAEVRRENTQPRGCGHRDGQAGPRDRRSKNAGPQRE